MSSVDDDIVTEKDSTGTNSDRVYLVSAPVDLASTIDIRRWLGVIWDGKWKLVAAAVLGGLLFFASSYLIQPLYQSRSVLSPVVDDGNRGLASLASQLGGISLGGLNLSPGQSLRVDEQADVVLKEHDYLIIKRIPEWDSIWPVTIKGEVVFPGNYRVQRGESLADIIQRAGGLTSWAFPGGAVFLREVLRAKEQEQLETLSRRMEADLASLALQTADSGGGDTLRTGQTLLDQLKGAEAVGRLVINLREDVAQSVGDIKVRDGDRLLVPRATQVVSVLGETQQNTSHLYQPGVTRDEYIDRSGGLTRRADKKLIYVVRANGAVVAANRSRWLGRGKNVGIRPGDTIVVPLDIDRMRPLTFWGNVTQILYQGAIAVAAVKSFSD